VAGAYLAKSKSIHNPLLRAFVAVSYVLRSISWGWEVWHSASIASLFAKYSSGDPTSRLMIGMAGQAKPSCNWEIPDYYFNGFWSKPLGLTHVL
jgi:hypothetical protein